MLSDDLDTLAMGGCFAPVSDRRADIPEGLKRAAMPRHFLVRECSNTGGCIDHGLLADCDDANIRPVKIEDYEYHPTDQRAHDVDG